MFVGKRRKRYERSHFGRNIGHFKPRLIGRPLSEIKRRGVLVRLSFTFLSIADSYNGYQEPPQSLFRHCYQPKACRKNDLQGKKSHPGTKLKTLIILALPL